MAPKIGYGVGAARRELLGVHDRLERVLAQRVREEDGVLAHVGLRCRRTRKHSTRESRGGTHAGREEETGEGGGGVLKGGSANQFGQCSTSMVRMSIVKFHLLSGSAAAQRSSAMTARSLVQRRFAALKMTASGLSASRSLSYSRSVMSPPTAISLRSWCASSSSSDRSDRLRDAGNLRYHGRGPPTAGLASAD